MHVECERNEWILRYLERGSQKSFVNFCEALKCNNQVFLLRGALHQQPCTSAETRRVPVNADAESAPVMCTQNTADEAKMTLPGTSAESTQGFQGYLNFMLTHCCLHFESVFCW